MSYYYVRKVKETVEKREKRLFLAKERINIREKKGEEKVKQKY